MVSTTHTDERYRNILKSNTSPTACRLFATRTLGVFFSFYQKTPCLQAGACVLRRKSKVVSRSSYDLFLSFWIRLYTHVLYLSTRVCSIHFATLRTHHYRCGTDSAELSGPKRKRALVYPCKQMRFTLIHGRRFSTDTWARVARPVCDKWMLGANVEPTNSRRYGTRR